MAGSGDGRIDRRERVDRSATGDRRDGGGEGAAGDRHVVGDVDLGAARELVVVGYDAWTEAVLAELQHRGASVTVITTDVASRDHLRDRDFEVVLTEDVDEACFRASGIETADAVLVATLDDQLNVLAVLTVMNVDPSMQVVTFAGEARDVPKLHAAGADGVISLGETIGELLVEVALTDRDVETVVGELVGSLG